MKGRNATRDEKIIALRGAGYSASAVAQRTGVSKTTVQNVLSLARRRGDPRASARVWSRQKAATAEAAVIVAYVIPASPDTAARRPRTIIDRSPPGGVIPFGEPAPGRSALDRRRAQ